MKDTAYVPQAEGNSGAEFEGNDEASDASSHLWSPFLLEFTNVPNERHFSRICFHSWLVQDLVGHSTGIIVGPFLIHSLHSVLPVWYTVLWLLISLGFALLNVYALLRHRQVHN